MTIWAYKISRDFGFAPNPFFGFCTVACCKPDIRRNAEPGDLIVGCGSAKLKQVGRIIFAMRVAEKLTFDQYWNDHRFQRKKPVFTAGKARSYGDNIYHQIEPGIWAQADSHHSFNDGSVNKENYNRDLGADAVLVATEFVYWGALAPPMPEYLRNLEGEDLYPNVRNFRNGYSSKMQAAAQEWFDSIPHGRLGRPISW